jgi:predicted Zn-dependent peptidase
VSVVGDFDPAELEECALKYLGTVSPEPKVELPPESATALGAPLQIRSGMPLQERHMVWHLKDSGALPACPPARPPACWLVG